MAFRQSTSGPAPAPTPDYLWDANDLTSLIVDGSNRVTRWTDLMAGVWLAPGGVQDKYKPIYTINAINSRAALDFNGADNNIQYDVGVSPVAFSLSVPNTIFLVVSTIDAFGCLWNIDHSAVNELLYVTGPKATFSTIENAKDLAVGGSTLVVRQNVAATDLWVNGGAAAAGAVAGAGVVSNFGLSNPSSTGRASGLFAYLAAFNSLLSLLQINAYQATLDALFGLVTPPAT